MAQFNEPFSTSSVAPQGSPSLIEGTPAVIQYAEAVIKVLPTAYFMAVGVVIKNKKGVLDLYDCSFNLSTHHEKR